MVEQNAIYYSNQIGQNAATIFEAVKEENYANSHRLNVKGSKYFSKLNTTLSLGSIYAISNREQLLNGNLADVENENLGFNVDLESEVTDWLSASYTGNFSFLQTRFEVRNFDEIRTQQHELDLYFYVAENQYFSEIIKLEDLAGKMSRQTLFSTSDKPISRNNYKINLENMRCKLPLKTNCLKV
ncbi:hypothetical protein [Salegentibacter sp. Hel_I_6]|uniref:hypothetical protein n=1 Tax=Salegentibacter sp. Hel_I_6 TaxID=1250278 RepID=UPI00055D5F02|nr:hypothetical protein [Salegentibacter sp. Hel_I_6]